MKLEQKESSETSAYKVQKPRNYPEENIEHNLIDWKGYAKIIFTLAY